MNFVLLHEAEPVRWEAPIDPVGGNLGFTVVVRGDATVVSNENEGTLAVGGDLIMRGDYRVAADNPGTYVDDGDARPTALVVGGRIGSSRRTASGHRSSPGAPATWC
ncbi:hypothetical protein Msi02_82320 [Microbispora siamensis]|uniref:Choice-of-anchor A domain-containing protein n=1 Tax=Microbispora siamensis TaxID=564413 RepID=A0ABQ4H147_9ACTN|nr:collagen-binding domain-containing protein [Microbispora siamensis]GIH67415.1 hypothetical protein Msi02_82320 [Microbispora siamensis]